MLHIGNGYDFALMSKYHKLRGLDRWFSFVNMLTCTLLTKGRYRGVTGGRRLNGGTIGLKDNIWRATPVRKLAVF